MKKILAYFFAVCFCLYFLAASYMYVNQRKFQYKPDDVSLEQLTTLAKDKGFELISYENKQNSSNVMGLFYPPADNKKPLILFLNGNKGDLVRAFGRIMPLVRQGYGAYIVIYQGFAPNIGKICQDNLFIDALNAYDFIKNGKKISEDKMVVYGYSLGTAVASFLAANRNTKALIIESGFSSMVDIAKVAYWFLPVKYILKDKLEAEKYIKNVKVPKLHLHGKADEVVPFYLGKKLFSAAENPKEFIEFKDGKHNLTENGVSFKILEWLKKI